MEQKNLAVRWPLIVATGVVWGLVEYGAGLGLQKCAAMMTGSVLTGISFFWLSLIRTSVKRILPLAVVVAIAMGLKLVSAAVSGVAWNHGSILNPMFALLTAFVGFSLVSLIAGKRFFTSSRVRIWTGAGAAGVAVLLFPLAGLVTGTPACLYGTGAIPVAWVTAPVAILISMAAVPLGHLVARGWITGPARSGYLRRFAIFR